MRKIFFFIAFSLSVIGACAQVHIPAPSPTQTLKQDFGLSFIELSYSRPGVKGRQVFGDLVPYGKVWRTGANQATTITFGDEVNFGGTKVPAGKYGLLTIPGKTEWTVILSKQLDVTSAAAYKQDQDLVRIPVKPYQLPFSIETFTIGLGDVSSNSCKLELMWDSIYVHVPITTEVDSKVMAQIDEAINKSNPPYYEAAVYYLNNDKDANKALEWLNKAAEKDPKGYYIYYQKARCLARLGKKQDAVATAQKSIQLAKEAGNEDYVALNEKLLGTLR